MTISIKQAVDFCPVFEKLAEHEKFNLKKLSQSDRKICLKALLTIEKAKLKDWNSEKKKLVDQKRLDKITKTLLSKQVKKLPKKERWYEKTFLSIAQAVHSLFLWFQNTFMGRVSAKILIDKIASYCQEVSIAKSKIEEINKEILPEVVKEINKKLVERDQEILKKKMSSEWLQLYKILLAIKSEAKQKSILSDLISFSHIDGIPDYQTVHSFPQIICDFLEPYFNLEESFSLAPYHALNASAIDLNKHKLSVVEFEDQRKEAEIQVQMIISKIKKNHSALLKAEEAELNNKKHCQKVFKEIKEISALMKGNPEEQQVAILLSKLKQEYDLLKKVREKLSKESEKLKASREELLKILEEKKKSFHECEESLLEAQKQVEVQYRELKVKYKGVTNAVNPYFISDLSKFVQLHLSELYASAKHAVKFFEDAEKSKSLFQTSKTPENEKEYNMCFQEYKEKINYVNKIFDNVFNLIQSNINLQVKRLDALKNGDGKQYGAIGNRLKISKLPFYGLQALSIYRQTLINKVALLKLKYNIL